jgi:hypothetical protein
MSKITTLYIPMILWRNNSNSEYSIQNMGVFIDFKLALWSVINFLHSKKYIPSIFSIIDTESEFKNTYDFRCYLELYASDDYFTNCNFEICERITDLEYMNISDEEN